MSPVEKAARVQRTRLTRALVVDTAVELVAEADDVSIRDLAGRLGVSPMALYRHVESKEDLLDETVDRLLAGRWRPEIDPRHWRDWTMDAADRLRHFLVERPAALAVYLRRPVRSTTALQRMDACLEVLRSAIDDEARVRSAYAAVHSYTLGFAALESARNANLATEHSAEDAVLHELVAYASPTQFRAGLRYLLDGAATGSIGPLSTESNID